MRLAGSFAGKHEKALQQLFDRVLAVERPRFRLGRDHCHAAGGDTAVAIGVGALLRLRRGGHTVEDGRCSVVLRIEPITGMKAGPLLVASR
jgi:hypothetical protein